MMMLGALALFLAAPVSADASAPEPIALFKSACLDGEIHLDPAQLKPIDFKHLPTGAKVAVGRSIYRGPGVDPYPPEPIKSDMPNPLYRIGVSQIFLIVPTPQATPNVRFADSCVVVWKGDGFEQARQFIQPGVASAGAVTAQRRLGIGYVSSTDGQRVLTAALADSWTVLRWAPGSTEPTALDFIPGAKKN